MTDSMDTMIRLHNTIQQIQLRLQIDCIAINKIDANNSINNVDELVDNKTKCLYYINLGHCYKHLVYIPIVHHIKYFEMYHSDENNDIMITGHTLNSQNGDYSFDYNCRKSYAEAGLHAYEKSKELASLICNSDAEPLLLLTNCLYCTHMCLFIENSYKEARKIAETVFLNAAEFTNTLGDDTLHLLQYIRDVFMASNDCPESLETLNFHDDNLVSFQNNPIVSKNKGKKHQKSILRKENLIVDIESFIAVKGFKALGNQLTTDKLKQVNLLEPLPYDEPAEIVPEELEVEGDTAVSDEDIQSDEDGQITLF